MRLSAATSPQSVSQCTRPPVRGSCSPPSYANQSTHPSRILLRYAPMVSVHALCSTSRRSVVVLGSGEVHAARVSLCHVLATLLRGPLSGVVTAAVAEVGRVQSDAQEACDMHEGREFPGFFIPAGTSPGGVLLVSCPTIGDMPRLRPHIQSWPLLRSILRIVLQIESLPLFGGGGVSIKSISRAFMPKLDSLFNQLIDSFVAFIESCWRASMLGFGPLTRRAMPDIASN
jgi:hypothetical protein